MGWGSYLVDKRNNLKLYVHKMGKEQFLDEVNRLNKILDELYELDEKYSMDYKFIKIKDLEVNDLKELLDKAEITDNLSCIQNLLPALYYLTISKKPIETYNLSDGFEFVSEGGVDKVLGKEILEHDLLDYNYKEGE